MRYDAFISYSHSADGELAKDLQIGLERLVKPWYRRKPFLRVFRDETSFAPGADLGDRIEGALDDADHLVLLLSEDSAKSPWVESELKHWLATKSKDDITIVVTEWNGPPGLPSPKSVGAAVAPPSLTDFDWAGEGLPPSLRGVYEEPLVVDMRWARAATASGALTLDDEQFADDVADVAAHVKGVNKDELIGALVGMRARARVLTGTIGLVVAVLLIGAVVALFGFLGARRAEDRARSAEIEALERQATAEAAATESELAAAEAATLEEEARRAQQAAEDLQADAEDATRVAAEARARAEEVTADATEARLLAETLRDDALTAATDAEGARTEAEAAQVDAEIRQRAAETARAEADAATAAAAAAQQDAEAARAEAEAARVEAESAEAVAIEQQVAAERARREAEQDQRDAEAARDAALKAQGEAEAAKKAADKQRMIEEALGDSTRLANAVDELIGNDLVLAQLLATESAEASLRAARLASEPVQSIRWPVNASLNGPLDAVPTPIGYASLLTALGENPRLMFVLTDHDRPVEAVAFTVDGSAIAARHTDATVSYWDASTGRSIAERAPAAPAIPDCPDEFTAQTSTCFETSVDGWSVVSDSGEVAATSSSEGDIQLYRARADGWSWLGNPTEGSEWGAPFQGPTNLGAGNGEFSKLAFSRDDRFLVTTLGPISGNEFFNEVVNPIYVWRVKSGAPQFAAPVVSQGVREILAMAANARTVVGVDQVGELVVADLEGSSRRRLPGGGGGVLGAALSADGSVAAIIDEHEIWVADLSSDPIRRIPGVTLPNTGRSPKNDVALSASGDLLVTSDEPRCGGNYGPYAVNVDLAQVIPSPSDLSVGSADVGELTDAGIRLMAVGTRQSCEPRRDNFQVYDVSDPAAPIDLGIPQDNERGGVVEEIAIAPDGLTVAAMSGGAFDNNLGPRPGSDVTMWELDPLGLSFDEGPTLHGHSPVSAIAFDPTGRIAVIGHDDGTIRLWDLELPVTALGPPLAAHGAAITSVVWQEGPASIYTTDGVSMMRWDFEIDRLMEFACLRGNRSLTPSEQVTYLRDSKVPVCRE